MKSMLSLEEQINLISQLFPTVLMAGKSIYEIKIFPKVSIEMDVSKYPKKPSIKLPKSIANICGDIEAFHPIYKNWNKEKPASIVEILKAYRRTIEMLSGVKAYLKKDLVADLVCFGNQQYPDEGICVLKSQDGMLSELVLNPGSSSSPSFTIFNPRSVRYDFKIIATCHFHPTGTADSSPEDLEAFCMYPVNIIISYPYSIENALVFNQLGQKIELELLHG